MMNPFVWKDGKAMTPDEVARQRLLSAAALGRAGDTSPVGHWSQGAARVVDTLGGVLREKRAGKAEAKGLAGADASIAAILAGQGGGGQNVTYSASNAPAPVAAPVDPAAAKPTGPEYSLGVDALAQSPTTPGGYSMGVEVAPAVDPALAARFPIPEDVKNGIFAGESGGDYNALFGFQNRPGGKFQNVKLTDMTVDDALNFAAPSGEYGQTVKGQIGRVATPMGAYQIVGTTLRAAKDGLGLTGNEVMTPELQDALGGWILANQGTGAWEGYKGPRDGYTPASGGAVSMSASNGSGGGQSYGGNVGGMDIASLLALQKDPWVTQKYGGVIDALMGQQFSRQNSLWEQQQKMADPMYQAQLQMAQLELDKAQAPAAVDPWAGTKEIGGVLYGPDMQPLITPPAGGGDGFTLSPGQQRFDAAGNPIASVDSPPPDPTVPTTKNVTLSDGSEALVQWNPATQVWDAAPIPQGGTGGTGQPIRLTEGQSKLKLFQTLQTETAPVLLELEKKFDPSNLSDPALSSVPIAGNYFASPEYQQYKVAASAWAEGALRISTGAAATPEEIERNLLTYFAQPGDTPSTVAFKAKMRDMYDRAVLAAQGQPDSGERLSLPTPSEFAAEVIKGGVPDATGVGGSKTKSGVLWSIVP